MVMPLEVMPVTAASVWSDNCAVLPKKPTTYYAIALVLIGFCIGDFVFSSYEHKALVAAIAFVLALLSLMMGTSMVLMRDGFIRSTKAKAEFNKKQ